MKFAIALIAVSAIVFAVVSSAAVRRQKRQASYLLPDGIEFILDKPIVNNFRCQDAGIYADIDNDCKIFHICDVQVRPDNVEEIRQYSFACPNTTMFNQFSMTCTDERDAVPCNVAPQFFRMNERIGKSDQLFHTEEDVAEAAQYIPSRLG